MYVYCTYTYIRRTCGGGLDVEVCHPVSFRNYYVCLLGRTLGLLIRYSVATLYVNFIYAHGTCGVVGCGGMPSSLFYKIFPLL